MRGRATQRVDLAALEDDAGDERDGPLETPELLALERAETRVALQFAAILHGDLRTVFMCHWQWTGDEHARRRHDRRATGLSLEQVRSAERAIEFKRKRFARIYSAGRLCGFLAPGIARLAAGDDVNDLEEAAPLAPGGRQLPDLPRGLHAPAALPAQRPLHRQGRRSCSQRPRWPSTSSSAGGPARAI